MGSDWIWELRGPVATFPALRQLYALAAEPGEDLNKGRLAQLLPEYRQRRYLGCGLLEAAR